MKNVDITTGSHKKQNVHPQPGHRTQNYNDKKVKNMCAKLFTYLQYIKILALQRNKKCHMLRSDEPSRAEFKHLYVCMLLGPVIQIVLINGWFNYKHIN